jgi:small subunit ribosomal protein S9
MANKIKKKASVQKVVKKQKPIVPQTTKAAKGVSVHFTVPSGEFAGAVGRRKTATARVRVYRQPGDFVVNDKLVSDYFRTIINAPALYNAPLIAIDHLGQHAITVKVSGSGLRAQLDAVNHGIARALIKLNPDLRGSLKTGGFLKRDDRMKETRKIGKGGKARRTKQSPKR